MTRNTAKTVRYLVQHLKFDFSAVLTRDFEPVKPAPEPVLHICGQWGIQPAEALVVGDYRDDILCGKAAGTRTCLLLNDNNRSYASLADHAASDLFQVREFIRGMLDDSSASK
jgi:phosphoglycolate phosphatase-like HAD superfamily hydrolase